jgi:tight adherence protein C
VDENLLLIPILSFAGVLSLILGVYLFSGQRRAHRELIERVKSAGEETVDIGEADFLATLKEKFLRVLGTFGHMAGESTEGKNPSHLRKRFLKAGYRKESAQLNYFGFKLILVILFPLVFSLVKMLLLPLMSSLHFMLLAILAAMGGYYLPSLWVQMKISQRKKKIMEGLPDALDLMVVCAEAGVGLDAAIQRVGEEMKLNNKTLSEEFRIMSLELRAGKPRRDALKDLAMRTDLEDVDNLASLLIQTERFGTSVAQALRVHSESMRLKRFQRAEEVAAKLPVKLLFPLIFFIFPALFVAILGPAVIQIIRTLLPTLGSR